MMRRTLMALIALCFVALMTCDIHAQGRRSRRVQWQPACTASSCQVVNTIPEVFATTKEPLKSSSNLSGDAIEEVNATRAARGLPPFKHDPQLTVAAREAARQRAASHIAGHLANDFACLPSGAIATAAGCGAWLPGEGWGTCCTYDNYTYAGAAWVMGSDGRRYMHIFCR